jgi:hypothetical protein
LGSYYRKLLERSTVTFNYGDLVYFEPIANCALVEEDINLCDVQLVAQDSARGDTGGYGGFPLKTLSKIDWDHHWMLVSIPEISALIITHHFHLPLYPKRFRQARVKSQHLR